MYNAFKLDKLAGKYPGFTVAPGMIPNANDRPSFQVAYRANTPPSAYAASTSPRNPGIARTSAMMWVGFRSCRADLVAERREILGPAMVVRRRVEPEKRVSKAQVRA